MVARANRRLDGIGGHLATYASAATPFRQSRIYTATGRRYATSRCRPALSYQEATDGQIPEGLPRMRSMPSNRSGPIPPSHAGDIVKRDRGRW